MSMSLNVVVDFADKKRLERALTYLIRTKAKSVVIAGGAQMDLTMQFVEQVRQALPAIRIDFRILEYTGIMIKLTPDEWWSRYITPRRNWIHANKLHIVVDNETSGNDAVIKLYVDRSIAIANKLHTEGIPGVYCRFATGNIDDGGGGSNQYPLLKPLLDRLWADDWIGPNEYTNAPGKSSGGHLARYKNILKVAGRPINVSIGECGILNNYAARAGYRGIPMTDEQMALKLLEDEQWYEGGSIVRHAFVIGGGSEWDSLQIGDGALEVWEDHALKTAPPVKPPVVTPPPIVIPPPVVIPPPLPPIPSTNVPIDQLKALQLVLSTNIATVQKMAVQLTSMYNSLSDQKKTVDALVQKAK